MSLDNIQLPSLVLESLYSKSLYDLKPVNGPKSLVTTGGIAFLGDCKKGIVLIVQSPETLYLPEKDLDFLLEILTACKLTMADIALINIENNGPLNYQGITVQLNSEKIVLFDIDPEAIGLPLQFPHYQLQHFNNQVYMSSVSLNELLGNKKEKLNLWNSLKKLFSIE